MSTNGKRDPQKAREDALERQKDHKMQMQEEQAALRDAFNADGQLEPGVIRELTSADDIAVGEGGRDGQILQAGTVAKISNMLSRDWVLANLTDAQEHDIRFKLEVMKLKIIGMHPPEEGISGNLRAFLMDDPSEQLQPLTQQERILIDELFETLKSRISRGRAGFERKQQNTSIAQTQRNESDDDDRGSSGWGLFG